MSQNGGGVMIKMSSLLKYTRRGDLKSQRLETVWAEVNLKSYNALVCCFYHSDFTASKSLFTSELQESIETVLDFTPYVILAGDINTDFLTLTKKLSLFLCDRENYQEELEGLRYELQDCCFENLVNVSISGNFCDVFSSADLAIILPSAAPDHRGYSEVEVSHSFLEARNFECLEGAVHKSVRRKDCLSVRARGPMSKAMAIGNYIKEAYQDSIKVVKLSKADVPSFPQLSSIQIYGTEGLDLYDELILPKIYPTALYNLRQTFSIPVSASTASDGAKMLETSSEEQLYERLLSTEQSEQVLLVYALEHVFDNENCETIEREQTELWSRL